MEQNPDLQRAHRHFAAGTVLFCEGDHGAHMYVIKRGAVRITRRLGSEVVHLADLRAGEFFGEMAILNDRPRSADATVLEDAELLVLDSPTLETMIRANSEIAIRMLKKVGHRLEQADDQIELLLFREQNHRGLHFLAVEAQRRGIPVPAGISISITEDELAERVSLSVDEVSQVVESLVGARLLYRGLDDSFVVSERGKLEDFLEYVSRREHLANRKSGSP